MGSFELAELDLTSDVNPLCLLSLHQHGSLSIQGPPHNKIPRLSVALNISIYIRSILL